MMNLSPSYLILFFIVMLACVVCVGYGVVRLMRYIVTERAIGRDTALELLALRTRLEREAASGQLAAMEARAEQASGVVSAPELSTTPEAQQALALLKVSGMVDVNGLHVSRHGRVFVFTRHPQMPPAAIDPPAWLVRLAPEKVDVVPAGTDVDVAVMKLNTSPDNAGKDTQDTWLPPNTNLDATN